MWYWILISLEPMFWKVYGLAAVLWPEDTQRPEVHKGLIWTRVCLCKLDVQPGQEIFHRFFTSQDHLTCKALARVWQKGGRRLRRLEGLLGLEG